MNIFSLSLAYIRARLVTNGLLVALLAMGVATIGLLLHFSSKAEERLMRDARGIDLVVGAKGSPLQLVLSSIYHMDIPTGNISAEDAEKIRKNPQVKLAIPLALGDSYKGYRIIGTEQSYIANYNGELASGQSFAKPFEAVIGSAIASDLRINVGASFAPSHGVGETGAEHAETAYKIVGVLKPTGTVLDRLILTPVESVWEIHGGGADEDHADEAKHDDHADEAKHDDHAGEVKPVINADGTTPVDHADEAKHDDHAGKAGVGKNEITALLVTVKSRAAAMSLPREINRQTALQAANPAFEAARLFSLLGLGLDTLRLFGAILIGSAVLGMLVAIYQAMRERRIDHGLMRVLGATRVKLMGQVIVESGLLLFAGLFAGVALCHAALAILPRFVPQLRDLGLSPLQFLSSELYVVMALFLVGLIVALIPAMIAYRVDVSRTLARA